MRHWQTYDPLVELGEIQGEDEDNLDGLELFMDYVNMALEADGVRDSSSFPEPWRLHEF